MPVSPFYTKTWRRARPFATAFSFSRKKFMNARTQRRYSSAAEEKTSAAPEMHCLAKRIQLLLQREQHVLVHLQLVALVFDQVGRCFSEEALVLQLALTAGDLL